MCNLKKCFASWVAALVVRVSSIRSTTYSEASLEIARLFSFLVSNNAIHIKKPHWKQRGFVVMS